MTTAEAPSIANIPASFTVGQRWYLVRSKRYRDKAAEEQIKDLGFETFRPCERKKIRHARRRITVERPLFGQVFFVRFDINRDPWHRINAGLWVDRIMCSKAGPMRVPDHAIKALQQAISEGRFDFTNEATGPFKIGEQVMVLDGPFEGMLAEVLRSPPGARGEILISFLGQLTKTSIEYLHLEKA